MAMWLNPAALGGAVIGAVALGIHLGESAIGLIDPVHFQGPAVHPRDRGAAVDPNRIRPSEPRYAELYGWDEGRAARLADCGGCEAIAARDAYAYSAEVPYFGGPSEPPRPRAEPPAPPEPAVPPPEREARIARYAYYPVELRDEVVVPDYAADDVYLDGDGNSGLKPGE